MQSTTLKNRIAALFRSKPALAYSEAEILELARALGRELKPGVRLLLNGGLGAGKTTFARGVLEGLKIRSLSEGSPTFPIVHEYETPDGVRVLHADLYRLEGNEDELEATGLLESLWNDEIIVLTEWLSEFSEVEEKLKQSTELISISLSLEIVPGDPSKRIVKLS